jgi:glycosyltransferase involved in cell wall biosynthesis
VLVEPIVVHRWWGKPFGPESNSKARPLSAYNRILNRAGFTLVDLRPASCLLANVIDTRRKWTFRALERYWDLLSRGVGRRERLGRAVGNMLRAVDTVATRFLAHGPSAKILVARRDSSAVARRAKARRVLIVPEWYPSKSEPSSGVFVRDQAKAVSGTHDVTVLFHDPDPRRAGEPPFSDCIEDGLRTIRVHTRSAHGTRAGRIAFLFVAARLVRDMRRRGEPADIVHAHVFSAGFVALVLSRLSRRGCAVVVTEHHTDFVEGKVVGRDARVARIVFKYADLVCPVSTRLKTHLEHLQPSGRYVVVPNVVDADAFALSRKHPLSHESTRLLVVAGLTPQKGLEYLFAALAEVHQTRADFTLDIVGDGPRRSALEQIARERLPADAVTFHGMRTRQEVAEFMARSDVFVLPSIVETFGVVLIEALAAGLPIITTRAVPDHERLEGRFGIVVPPKDAGALRDAVLAMLDRRWKAPRNAAAEVVRSYSAATVSGQWSEVYAMVPAP